jgi:hypothetical protein
MNCISSAIAAGAETLRNAGKQTQTSAIEYKTHPNEFVLRPAAASTKIDQNVHGLACMDVAAFLGVWLAELSMELADHKVLFARVHIETFEEMVNSNLLTFTAACLGVVAARRAESGNRWFAHDCVSNDFLAAAENALGEVPFVKSNWNWPTIASLSVLGEDDLSMNAFKELCDELAARLHGNNPRELAPLMRALTSNSFSYTSLLFSCDFTPIPTKQSRRWIKCLRNCCLMLSSPTMAAAGELGALEQAAAECPEVDFLDLLRRMRHVRAFEVPVAVGSGKKDWSFLVLMALALLDDSFAIRDVDCRLYEAVGCLCALSRSKHGITLLSRFNQRSRELPCVPDFRAEALVAIARSPSGFMTPGFSTPEAMTVLCDWALGLLECGDERYLTALREFFNVPTNRRTQAWSELLKTHAALIDQKLELAKGPLPPCLSDSPSKFRISARCAIDDACRTRVVRDLDRAVALCAWIPVNPSDKHDLRLFARRFAEPLSVDSNDAIYEFEDSLRTAWSAFKLEESGFVSRQRLRRFDNPRLDEATDAVIAAASDHHKCVSTCSDVDGRLPITVAHWALAQTQSLRLR